MHVEFYHWTISVDIEQTGVLYADLEQATQCRCNCVTCRNYRLQMPESFPAEFKGLLNKLRIDPAQEVELQHIVRTAGKHLYQAEFQFVGTFSGPDIAHNADEWLDLSDVFSVGLSTKIAVPISPGIDNLSALVYQCRIPWKLPAEIEPD